MSYLDWFSDTATGPAKPKANVGGRVGTGIMDATQLSGGQGTMYAPAGTFAQDPGGGDSSAYRAPQQPAPIPQGNGGGGSMSLMEQMWANPGIGSMQPGHVLSTTPKKTPAMMRAEREKAKWAKEDRTTQQKLIDDLMGSQSEAKEAGLARYQELMDVMSKLTGQVGGTFDAALGEMEGMGTAGRTRIGEGRTRALAESEQDLMSRGLSNTTIRRSDRRGIKSDYERQLQELNERVSGQRSGLLERRAGAEMDLGRLGIDTRLSRQDVGPDVSQYLSLIQMLGQSQ